MCQSLITHSILQNRSYLLLAHFIDWETDSCSTILPHNNHKTPLSCGELIIQFPLHNATLQLFNGIKNLTGTSLKMFINISLFKTISTNNCMCKKG